MRVFLLLLKILSLFLTPTGALSDCQIRFSLSLSFSVKKLRSFRFPRIDLLNYNAKLSTERNFIMIYPAVSKLIQEDNQCRYSLVIAVAKEARTIAERANNNKERLTEKPIKMAVNAFADGKATYNEVVD